MSKSNNQGPFSTNNVIQDNLGNNDNYLKELNENRKSSTNLSKTDHNGKSEIVKSKTKIIKKVLLCFLGILIIVGSVLLIGHLNKGWFKKKKNLVVIQKREEDYISRYLEIKNSTQYYYVEGENETQKVQNFTILTDFIVTINKKNKIDKIYNFNEIDYLYESYLLIINITQLNETNSVYLGGMNIYDESKSIKDLIKTNNEFFSNISLDENYQNNSSINKTQNNIPFALFYFYENGTLDEIYFPKNVNEFYKTAIIDLIEKVTPKLSNSLYKNETDKRRLEIKKEGIYLDYEQIIKSGKLSKTKIYEDKFEKNIDKNEYKYTSDRYEINSKIIRTFNSFGDMILLEMEGEATFKNNPLESKKNINLKYKEKGEEKISANESYYNLGLDEFKMNVTANMELIQITKDPLTLQNLNILCQMLNLEKYINYKKNLDNENDYIINDVITNKNQKQLLLDNTYDRNNISKIIDTFDINNVYNIYDTYDLNDTNITENLKKNLTNNKNINYLYSYKTTYKILSVNFLGLNIDLQQNLYINKNDGLRQNDINLIIGSEEIIVSTVNISQHNYSGLNTISKTLSDKHFELLEKRFKSFGYLIKASFYINCYLNHGISIDIIKGEMFTKGFTFFDLGVSGSLGPDFIFISFGTELVGHIAQGNTYIQANTLLNINSNKTYFLYYKKLYAFRVDLELYFSISLLFWEKNLRENINLFNGISSYDFFYQYK